MKSSIYPKPEEILQMELETFKFIFDLLTQFEERINVIERKIIDLTST